MVDVCKVPKQAATRARTAHRRLVYICNAIRVLPIERMRRESLNRRLQYRACASQYTETSLQTTTARPVQDPRSLTLSKREVRPRTNP